MSKYLLMLFLLILPGFSQAGDNAIDDELVAKIAGRTNSNVADVRKALEEGCSSGITFHMRQCAYFRQVGADIRLNETYQQLMTALGTSTARQKLVQAQRAWIAFRDASCDYEADSWVGGSGHGIIYSGCLEELTMKRTQELNDYLDCRDNGCPGDMPR